MKKRLIVIGAGLTGAVLLWLAGHLILPANPEYRAPKEITNAQTIYTDSLSGIRDAQDVILNISIEKETTVEDAVFKESSQQWLSYLGLGTENMRAALTETLVIDDHRAQITEVYSAGTGYITVNGSAFCGSISDEAYLKRFAPAILLDPAHYQSVTGFNTWKNYMIRFEQAVTAEPWALEQDTVFISGEGTAYVSYDGILLGSTYMAVYQQGNATIRLNIQVDVEPITTEIPLPSNTDNFQPIDYLDAPRMLERATGYLLQADHVSAKYADDIYCQVFGDRRTQEVSLHTVYTNEDWTALVNTQTNLANESKVGLNSNINKTEVYKKDTYQSSTNDGQWITNNQVTADEMHAYCKNLLIGTVMLPQYISGAQVVETENIIRIVFTGNDTFTPLICSNICQTLYQKPELLTNMAQSNKTNILQCYLELDKTTSLPVASGIHYDGTVTVEGIPYIMRFKADQTYDLLSKTAHEEIDKAGA